MRWRKIYRSPVKPDNVDPKVAHETLLEIIAERKARDEHRNPETKPVSAPKRAKR